MKKNLLIVLMICAIALIFSACVGAVGPTDPDKLPKSITKSVKYIRVLPMTHPDYPDEITLNWTYSPNQGGVKDMPRIEENTFEVGGVTIMTETVINMSCRDPRLYNGISDVVTQDIYFNNQLIPSSGQFIYGNDGTIRKPGG